MIYSPRGYKESDTTEGLSLHFTHFPYSEAESQGPNCRVTFQCVHLIVFRVSVTSQVMSQHRKFEFGVWLLHFPLLDPIHICKFNFSHVDVVYVKRMEHDKHHRDIGYCFINYHEKETGSVCAAPCLKGECEDV